MTKQKCPPRLPRGAASVIAKYGDRVVARLYGSSSGTVEGVLQPPEYPVDEPPTVRLDCGRELYVTVILEVLDPVPDTL